jgi:hypothetical protein
MSQESVAESHSLDVLYERRRGAVAIEEDRQALSGAVPTTVAVDSHGDIYSTSGTEVFEPKLTNGRCGASVVLPFRDDGTLAAIAVTPSGSQVVVAGDRGAAVLELTAGASGYGAQRKLDFKGLSDVTAITVDSRGDVYVVDGGTAEILELPKTASGPGPGARPDNGESPEGVTSDKSTKL